MQLSDIYPRYSHVVLDIVYISVKYQVNIIYHSLNTPYDVYHGQFVICPFDNREIMNLDNKCMYSK